MTVQMLKANGCRVLGIDSDSSRCSIARKFGIKTVDLSKKEDEVYQTVMGFCKSYEELCQKKYPEAPLPLEILKSIN